MEGTEGNETENFETVRLRMTTDMAQQWYQDKQGNVVVLDDAADAERDRQQREPDSPPAAGYPKFSPTLSIEDIPLPSGQLPPDNTPAGTQSASLNRGPRQAVPPQENPQAIPPIAQAPTAEPTYTPEQLQDLKIRYTVLLNSYEDATPEQLQELGDRIAQMQNYAEVRGIVGDIKAIGGRHAAMPPPGLFSAAGTGTLGGAPPTGPRGPGQAPTQTPPAPSPRGFVPQFVRRNRSREIVQSVQMQHEPPTMDKVLADKKMQKDIHTLLTNSKFNRPDLVEKYTRSMEDPNAMAQADWDALTAVRTELERRSLLSAELASGISKEDMLTMLQQEAQFAFLRNSLSPERAGEIIRQNMSSVFMQMSDDEIDQAVFAHRANQDIRASKQYQGLIMRTKRVLGNPEATPENVTAVNDPRLLSSILRPGFFAIGESKKRSAMTLDSVNINIKSIQQLLGATISRDAELRMQVVREASGKEHVPLPGTSGPASYQEAQRGADAVASIQNTQNRIAQFKQGYAQQFGVRWADDTPAQREENFFNTVGQEEAQRQGYPSWFGGMLVALIGMLIGKARNDSRVKPLFAAA